MIDVSAWGWSQWIYLALTALGTIELFREETITPYLKLAIIMTIPGWTLLIVGGFFR